MISKYFLPAAYWNKLKLLIAATVLRIGIPLKVVIRIDDYDVVFLASTFLEYFLRAREAYVREPLTVNWMRHYVAKDDVVYDIGANIGGFSLYLGKKVSEGKGVVYAFEPEASNFQSLNRNIVLNGLTGKVIPYPIAFGDARRVGKFYLSSTESGSSMHSIDKEESEGHYFSAQHIQGIGIYSLNDFVLEPDILFPSHIKIDVDGVETQIVQHMDQIIFDSRLRSVMIEINEDISKGMIERTLLNAGFEECDRERWPGKNVVNVLFTRTA